MDSQQLNIWENIICAASLITRLKIASTCKSLNKNIASYTNDIITALKNNEYRLISTSITHLITNVSHKKCLEFDLRLFLQKIIDWPSFECIKLRQLWYSSISPHSSAISPHSSTISSYLSANGKTYCCYKLSTSQFDNFTFGNDFGDLLATEDIILFSEKSQIESTRPDIIKSLPFEPIHCASRYFHDNHYCVILCTTSLVLEKNDLICCKKIEKSDKESIIHDT